MLKLMLVAVFASCTPTYYVGARAAHAKNPCPTLSTVLADFFVGGALLGVSVLKQNAGKTPEALAYGAGGMTVFLTANVMETVCRR